MANIGTTSSFLDGSLNGGFRHQRTFTHLARDDPLQLNVGLSCCMRDDPEAVIIRSAPTPKLLPFVQFSDNPSCIN